MSLVVRPYSGEDRAAVQHVFYRSVREGAAHRYNEAQRAAWAPRQTPDPENHDKLLDQWAWVAEDDGAVVGIMSLCPDGYLDLAFVVPEAMRRGIADALYFSLLAKARCEALERLTVHASHYARSFFARHGWHVDTREDHAANGQVYERFAMSLELKEVVG